MNKKLAFMQPTIMFFMVTGGELGIIYMRLLGKVLSAIRNMRLHFSIFSFLVVDIDRLA